MKTFYYFNRSYLTQNNEDCISDYNNTNSKYKSEMSLYIKFNS